MDTEESLVYQAPGDHWRAPRRSYTGHECDEEDLLASYAATCEPVWVSSDCTVRVAHQFESEHLLNTIRFLRREYDAIGMAWAEGFAPRPWWTVPPLHQLVPIYPALLAEAERRGLVL